MQTPAPHPLDAAIAALEAQRAALGDAAVDAAIAALRTKVAPPADPAPVERRQVTILFADIVGSTSLSQHLEPEEIEDILDGALRRFGAVVEREGGEVRKFMGDGMMAVFGARGVREDDAERAVRASLALVEEAAAYRREIEARGAGSAFDIRVGLHTGLVLLGGGVDGAGNIRGMPVNIAARMEQTAPAGGVRISEDTYSQVRGLFEAEEQPALHVKGSDAPILTWLIRGRAANPPSRIRARGAAGQGVPLVGRGGELRVLRNAYAKAQEGAGAMQTVLVLGDAGMGKSRLLEAYRKSLMQADPAPLLLEAGASPQSRSAPFELLRDVFLRWAGTPSAAPDAGQRLVQALHAVLAGSERADTAAANSHLLGHLLGFDFRSSPHLRGILEDTRQIRRRAFIAGATALRRIGATQRAPLVLLLDDVHWADEGTLSFVAHLKEVAPDAPVVIACFSRPTVLEKHGDWAGSFAMHRVSLERLAPQDTRALASEILGGDASEPLLAMLEDRTRGNPFYIEELLRMLRSEGSLQQAEGGWAVAPGGGAMHRVPSSLVGIIHARLDSLPPADKRTAQQAAVLGSPFTADALSALDGGSAQALPSLLRHDLLVAQPGAGGAVQYAFRHQILQDVTYETILRSVRRDWHAKAAAWLASPADVPNDRLAAIAEHYDRAGDAARACEYFARAASHAASLFAHEAVLELASRGLELATSAGPAGAQLRWRLLSAREATLDLMGERERQRADAAALLETAEALGDDARRATALLRQAHLAMRLRDLGAQAAAARRAMECARRAGDERQALLAQRSLADALLESRDPAGRALAEEGLAAARRLGLRLVEGLFINTLSVDAFLADRIAESLELDRLELAIYRELGNPALQATTVGNVGSTLAALGALAEAREALQESLRLNRAVGNRHPEAYVLHNLARIATCVGDHERARDEATQARDIAVELLDPELEAVALCRLGDAELALGRADEAHACFARSAALAEELKVALRWDAEAGCARVALSRGDTDEALRIVHPIVQHFESGGPMDGAILPRLAMLTCYRVLHAAQDGKAHAMLRMAHDSMHERAATIPDAALRESFLHNLPEHREIAQAWLHAVG